MLLSRSPLGARRPRARLACFRHAASVHPEPGSNSPSAASPRGEASLSVLLALPTTLHLLTPPRCAGRLPVYPRRACPCNCACQPVREAGRTPVPRASSSSPNVLPRSSGARRHGAKLAGQSDRGGGLGSGLGSHGVAPAVASALGRFTAVFGMGTGGTTPPAPPGPPPLPHCTASRAGWGRRGEAGRGGGAGGGRGRRGLAGRPP